MGAMLTLKDANALQGRMLDIAQGHVVNILQLCKIPLSKAIRNLCMQPILTTNLCV